MIKAFFLRIAKQAVEEFLTPQFEALRAELHGEIEALRADMDKRFDEVDKRLNAVEKRLDKIEGELESHGEQLARLDQRVIDLKDTMDIERRLARLEAQAGMNQG